MSRSERESYACNRADAERLDARKARIRDLNDRFRTTGQGGRIVTTSGIRALGPEALGATILAIRRFDSFDPGNDPYDEHDFGAVEIGHWRIFWKVDCYDKQLEYGSPDPTDEAVTARVMTIMLAEEY